MKKTKKYLLAVLCLLVALAATACSDNGKKNDQNGTGTGVEQDHNNNDVTEGDGVINDVGDAVGDGINDLGDGVKDVTDDLTNR